MISRNEIDPVPSGSDYVDAQKLEFGFMAHIIYIHFREGTNAIKFSFNGQDDHVVVKDDSGYLQSVELTEDATEIWYSGGSGDEIVEVIAIA